MPNLNFSRRKNWCSAESQKILKEIHCVSINPFNEIEEEIKEKQAKLEENEQAIKEFKRSTDICDGNGERIKDNFFDKRDQIKRF